MTRLPALYLLLLALVAPAAQAAEMPRAPLTVVRADGVEVRYTVEIARSADERRQGLMGRRRLAADAGMLFDFGQEQTIAMWMRNTYIALDMLFADADGRIVDIIVRTVPFSETLQVPRAAARYVVELVAGQVATRGIAIGDRLRLPDALRTSSAVP